MKALGLDWGIRRTGVAVTDDGGTMAFPRAVIVMTTREAFFATLLGLLEKERAQVIAVGLPLSLDGAETPTTRQVRNFVARLKRRTALPVFYVPEALSSSEAALRLAEAGVRGLRQRPLLDAQAAAVILESFLGTAPEKRMRA